MGYVDCWYAWIPAVLSYLFDRDPNPERLGYVHMTVTFGQHFPYTFSFQDFQPAVTTSPVTQESTTTTTFSSIFPPWQQQHSRDDSVLSVGSSIHSPTSDKSVASSTITSTLDRRLVQSQSAPASGLSALAAGGSSNIKLPRAQNPTITLLQKARGTWRQHPGCGRR